MEILYYRILDNLPVAAETMDGTHELGFPLGRYIEDLDKHAQLYNHVKIRIGYHVPEGSARTEGRIVDFTAFPYSFEYKESNKDGNDKMKACEHADDMPMPLYLYPSKPNQEAVVYWTSSVEWEEMPDREWRTRWDVYFDLGSGNDDVCIIV